MSEVIHLIAEQVTAECRRSLLLITEESKENITHVQALYNPYGKSMRWPYNPLWLHPEEHRKCQAELESQPPVHLQNTSPNVYCDGGHDACGTSC